MSKIIHVVSNEASNGAAEGFARSKALSLLNSGINNISQVVYHQDSEIRVSIRGGQAYIYISGDFPLWAAVTSPAFYTGEGFKFGLGKDITSVKDYSTSDLKTALQIGIVSAKAENPILILNAFGDNTYVMAIRHSAKDNIFIGSIYGEGKKQQWFAIDWAGALDRYYTNPIISKYEENEKLGVSFFGMNYINSLTDWSAVSRTAFQDSMPAEEPPKVLFNWRLGFEEPVERPAHTFMVPDKCVSNTPVGAIIRNLDIVSSSFFFDSTEPLKIFIANAGGGLRTVVSLADVLPANSDGRYAYDTIGAWYIGSNKYAIAGRALTAFGVYTRFILVFDLNTQTVVVKSNIPNISTPRDPFPHCLAIGPGVFIVYYGTQYESDLPRVYSNYGLLVNPISTFPTIGFEDQYLRCTKFLDPTNSNSQAELYLVAKTFGGEQYIFKGTYALGDAAVEFTLVEQKPQVYTDFQYLGKTKDATFSEQLDSIGS